MIKLAYYYDEEIIKERDLDNCSYVKPERLIVFIEFINGKDLFPFCLLVAGNYLCRPQFDF